MKENHNVMVMSKLFDNLLVRWDKDIEPERFLDLWNSAVENVEKERDTPTVSQVIIFTDVTQFEIELPIAYLTKELDKLKDLLINRRHPTFCFKKLF